jgi:hypothetical protein
MLRQSDFESDQKLSRVTNYNLLYEIQNVLIKLIVLVQYFGYIQNLPRLY